jgi:hypothetical protein
MVHFQILNYTHKPELNFRNPEGFLYILEKTFFKIWYLVSAPLDGVSICCWCSLLLVQSLCCCCFRSLWSGAFCFAHLQVRRDLVRDKMLCCRVIALSPKPSGSLLPSSLVVCLHFREIIFGRSSRHRHIMEKLLHFHSSPAASMQHSFPPIPKNSNM